MKSIIIYLVIVFSILIACESGKSSSTTVMTPSTTLLGDHLNRRAVGELQLYDSTKIAYTVTDNSNVRKGPSANAKLHKKYNKNVKVEELGYVIGDEVHSSSFWKLIRTDDGTGYIHEYLINESRKALPNILTYSLEDHIWYIKLQNGKSIVLKEHLDLTEGKKEEYAKLSFVDFYVKEGYLLLYGSYFEYWNYILINISDGIQTTVTSEPIFSPSRKHFYVDDITPMSGNKLPSGFSIWEISPRLQEVHRYQGYKDGFKVAPVNAKWESDTELSYTIGEGEDESAKTTGQSKKMKCTMIYNQWQEENAD